ncbi:hypothetical protein ElyMa_006467400 [Elysia marginata]|uniref:Uncharacterized protein n=1 Tax=Elysia marginata TaxID=1093978 RepID=A0AAV4I153_9GAST|nr:hypothetical protein ElyMa_006467400 [Elysia marginata]
MRDFFVSCSYPLEILDDAWNRVYNISRTDALIPRPEQSSQRTKLIMTYTLIIWSLARFARLTSTISVFFKLTPMLVRFLMSLLLLCSEERKTFATCWFAVGSLRLMTQEPDLAGDIGVKLVLMCHNLVKSTRLVVFSRLLTHLPALVAT